MDNSSMPRHLLLVFLIIGFLIAPLTFSGCKAGMMSNVRFPNMFAGRDKNKPEPPPSRHFDGGSGDQSSDADTRVVIDEPDISAVAALDASKPSQQRTPTLPENGVAKNQPDNSKNAAAGSSGFGFPDGAGSLAKNNSPGSPESPIRKPYVSPDINGDPLKDAASRLNQDLDRMSQNSRSGFSGQNGEGLSPLKSPPSTSSQSNWDSGSATGQVTNESGNQNPLASQFLLPNASPVSPPAGADSEKSKFGFSVPPNSSNNGTGQSAPGSTHITNQFVSVPGSSQPINGQATLSPLQPRSPAAEGNPPSSSNPGSFPSTGFGAYVLTPPAGNNSPANPDNGATTGDPTVNSRWSTMPQTSSPTFAPNNNAERAAPTDRIASSSSGLPAALQQRSGSYSPGSTGNTAATSGSPWH